MIEKNIFIKHVINIFTILSVVFFVANGAFAQQRKILKSHQNMKRLEAIDSSIVDKRAQIEAFIKQQQVVISPLEDAIIPVVFHILDHINSDKITEQQVLEQLAALNRDFASADHTLRHEAIAREGFNERIESIGIRFCLPKLLGNGRAIFFYKVDTLQWSMNDGMKNPIKGGIIPWETDKYLNIWVVDLEKGNAGYAQLPGGPMDTDGIVIDKDFFGVTDETSLYRGNKTLTHLVGNYLGLHSLWGEDRCADDYVTDTPIHNAPNYGCSDYKHFSICTGEVEMTMNFMDTSADECLQFFTTGQKYRLHAFLSPGGPRAGLLTIETECYEPLTFESEPSASILPINAQLNQLPPNSITVYPNPTKGLITIAFNWKKQVIYSLQVVDGMGKEVLVIPNLVPFSNTLNVDASTLTNGIYWLSIKEGSKVMHTEKVEIIHSN